MVFPGMALSLPGFASHHDRSVGAGLPGRSLAVADQNAMLSLFSQGFTEMRFGRGRALKPVRGNPLRWRRARNTSPPKCFQG